MSPPAEKAGPAVTDLDAGEPQREARGMATHGLGDHVIGAPRIRQALGLDAAGRDRDDRPVDACPVHRGEPCLHILADAVGDRAADMAMRVDDAACRHDRASSIESLRPALPDL